MRLALKERYVFGAIVLAVLFVGTYATYAATVDSGTVLLIHADGANTKTVFSDTAGHTMTTNGNAQLSTAQSKFGGASALFDGASDYLTTPDNTDFEMGSGNFTIDLWAYPTSVTGSAGVIGKGFTSGYSPYIIYRSSGTWLFYATSADGSWNMCSAISMGTATINTWHHLAVVRNGSTFTTYLNGTQQATCSSASSVWDNSNNVRVGSYYEGETATFAGYLDEVRISKGIARWTSNFTPQTTPYAGGITLTGDVKFMGALAITGALSKGAGTFVIDHPLRPRTELLYHSFVESPDVKNIYDGIATLDENGEAIITLPDYFEALNKDFRYQFFALYEPMPDLHVKTEEKGNSFAIGGGAPGGQISWQITGTRHDPYILANPIIVEVLKSGEPVARGECLYEPLCDK